MKLNDILNPFIYGIGIAIISVISLPLLSEDQATYVFLGYIFLYLILATTSLVKEAHWKRIAEIEKNRYHNYNGSAYGLQKRYNNEVRANFGDRYYLEYLEHLEMFNPRPKFNIQEEYEKHRRNI